MHSWAALNDLRTLARGAGYKGFVLLVDEVEEVIYNLNHLKWQQIAFRNLIRFFSPEGTNVMSLFPVTPDFKAKCRELLIKRDKWSEEFALLEKLPRFHISPLGTNELEELVTRIAEIHGMAYEWEDNVKGAIPEVEAVVERPASSPVADIDPDKPSRPS